METTILKRSERKSSRGRQPNGEPNPIDVHIGNRLKLRRQVLQLSQQQLGKMMGLTFQQVQKYERGQNRISGSRLWDFASVLGVDVNFFFADMDRKIFMQSPRCLNDCLSADFVDLSKDPLQSEQVLKLVKAFLQIKKTRIKNDIYNLIISIATSNYFLDKTTTT